MRSLLRSLTFGLAATIAGASMAQQPYWVYVFGEVPGCTSGQVVTLSTTVETVTTTVFGDCMYAAVVTANTNPSLVTISTPCNGFINMVFDSAFFVGVQDSTVLNINLNCTNSLLDCLGVPNGPNMPGTACDDGNPMTSGDLWSPACVCAGSDTSNVVDCLGIPGGPNMVGTFCTTFLGDTGVWNVNCICETNTLNYDCLGILDGPNLPNTPCDDNNPNTLGDLWNAVCVCIGVPDSTNTGDCLGNPGGGALPGTPCVVPGTILPGVWSAECICEANNPVPCQADFWVVQAYGSDSLPVPYEVWVWNLSGGGTGIYTYNWSFGDGTTSTDAYPTHVYDGNGPYALCLTIADSDGCTSTHCDTISIDGDGFFGGFHSGGGDRQDGFTLNVRNPSAVTSINEWNTGVEIAAWPNPAKDVLNLAIANSTRGAVEVTIHDLRGQVMLRERHTLTGMRDQLSIATENFGAGLYLVRVGNENGSTSIRFVKAD